MMSCQISARITTTGKARDWFAVRALLMRQPTEQVKRFKPSRLGRTFDGPQVVEVRILFCPRWGRSGRRRAKDWTAYATESWDKTGTVQPLGRFRTVDDALAAAAKRWRPKKRDGVWVDESARKACEREAAATPRTRPGSGEK